MANTYPINIWINEERYNRLNKAGLANMAQDMLAGMKVLRLCCSEEQKNRILELFPMAKYDASTTKSIELLPVRTKDNMLELVIEKERLDIIDEFLKSASPPPNE